MANYFVVQDSANHWLVKFTRFGANSEIVETFTTRRAAVAYAKRLNATL